MTYMLNVSTDMLFAYFLFSRKSTPLSFSLVTVQRKQTARFDVLTAALLKIEVKWRRVVG